MPYATCIHVDSCGLEKSRPVASRERRDGWRDFSGGVGIRHRSVAIEAVSVARLSAVGSDDS